jgi:hypothetical protein
MNEEPISDDVAYGYNRKIASRVRQHYNESKRLKQFCLDFQLKFINKLIEQGDRERATNIAAFLGLALTRGNQYYLSKPITNEPVDRRRRRRKVVDDEMNDVRMSEPR